MKGLWVKDLLYLSNQKVFLLFFSFTVLLNGVQLKQPVWIFFLLSFFMVFFALLTITYDKQESGMEYVLALPISKRDYVIQKYALTLVMIAVSIVISYVLYAVMCLSFADTPHYAWKSMIEIILMIVLISVFSMCLMIPLYIRYSGNNVLYILSAAFVFTGMGVGTILMKFLQKNLFGIKEILAKILTMRLSTMILLDMAFCVVLLVVSAFASMRFIRRPAALESM